MVHPRKKISWKDQPIVTKNIPHYVPSPESSEKLKESWIDHLKVGTLWSLSQNMDVLPGTAYLKRAPHRLATLSKGALAIYIGTERYEELRNDSTLLVLRHVFVVGGGRYVVTDFNNIEPVI